MQCLWDRSILGGVSSRRAAALFRENRLRFLDVSSKLEIQQSPDQEGPIVCLDIDKVSDTMLLSGGKDSSLSIFNLEEHNTEPISFNKFENITRNTISPIAHVGRQSGHKFAVTAVQWYPVDNGCFISGGHDGMVKIWATESCKTMKDVKCARHVYAAKMPHLGSSHCLIAVATDEGDTQLIDIRAGCAIQRLSGHDGAVWSLDWCPTSEYMLASGGRDNTVRIFDIRQSGESACRTCLDQYMAHGLPEDDAPYLPHPSVSTSPKHWWGLNQTQSSHFVRTRVRNHIATAHLKSVHAVCFSPDGRYLVSSAAGDGVHLWNLTTTAPSLCPVHFPHANNQVISDIRTSCDL